VVSAEDGSLIVRWLRQQVARVLEQQEQLLLSDRRRLETESLAEARSFVIDRVRQQRPHAGLIRDGDRARDRLLRHADADPLALVLQRHRQPGQDDHGNRKAAHALADSVRYFQGVGLTHGPS
jgi:hypothetical protein